VRAAGALQPYAQNTHRRATVISPGREIVRLVVPYGPIRAPAGALLPASRSPTHQTDHPQPEVPKPMATARPTLDAANRELTGKAVNRLRKEGRLPGVVFGHGLPSSNVSVDTHDFEQLRRHAGPNALIDLSVDGGKVKPVLVQHVQVHPVNRRPLHVDLFAVRMTEELTVDVPLVATGESTAVTSLGGTLLHPNETIKVKALPDHLPQFIEYSVETLIDFDGTIKVSDLTIPGDVTLLTEGDEVIATVQRPRVEVEEVAPEVEEGAEGAEGAEGEPAVAGEGGQAGEGDEAG
jgi:large subunit ribosomal protein L25